MRLTCLAASRSIRRPGVATSRSAPRRTSSAYVHWKEVGKAVGQHGLLLYVPCRRHAMLCCARRCMRPMLHTKSVMKCKQLPLLSLGEQKRQRFTNTRPCHLLCQGRASRHTLDGQLGASHQLCGLCCQLQRQLPRGTQQQAQRPRLVVARHTPETDNGVRQGAGVVGSGSTGCCMQCVDNSPLHMQPTERQYNTSLFGSPLHAEHLSDHSQQCARAAATPWRCR